MARPAAGATALPVTAGDNRRDQVRTEAKMKALSNRDPRDDEARLASNEKIARLRTLPLTKEAADRETAEQSAAAKRAEIKSRSRAARGANPKLNVTASPLRRRLAKLPASHHL
jgi:hypothetical protein